MRWGSSGENRKKLTAESSRPDSRQSAGGLCARQTLPRARSMEGGGRTAVSRVVPDWGGGFRRWEVNVGGRIAGEADGKLRWPCEYINTRKTCRFTALLFLTCLSLASFVFCYFLSEFLTNGQRALTCRDKGRGGKRLSKQASTSQKSAKTPDRGEKIVACRASMRAPLSKQARTRRATRSRPRRWRRLAPRCSFRCSCYACLQCGPYPLFISLPNGVTWVADVPRDVASEQPGAFQS